MRKNTYEEIVDILLEDFPEYGQSKEYDSRDKEFQYAIMAGFGRFLTQIVEDQSSNKQLIQRVFEFINQVYNGPQINNKDNTDTLQNLLYIEIFENLAQTKLGVEAARKHLLYKAKNDFETVFRYTGVENDK